MYALEPVFDIDKRKEKNQKRATLKIHRALRLLGRSEELILII